MVDNADGDSSESEKEEDPKEPKKPKVVKILILASVLVLSVLGGGTFFVFQNPVLVGLGPEAQAIQAEKEEKERQEAKLVIQSEFIDIPEIIADLQGARGNGSHIRIMMTLEVGTEEEVDWIKAIQPRIIDAVQVYLRKQNRETFLGNDGTQRARKALHAVIEKKTDPVRIKSVLFKKFLVR